MGQIVCTAEYMVQAANASVVGNADCEHNDYDGGKRMNKLLIAALLTICLATPNMSWAANARDYIPLPSGTFLFCTYFKHITANTFFANGKKTSDDYNFNENLGILRPVYYTTIGKALYGDGGLTIDPQALIPFGEFHLDGAAVLDKQFSASGIADPTVFATFWFVNSPKDKFWIGFSPYITMPLGQYDKNRGALNLGTNRWTIRPELGIVKGFGDKTYLDVIFNGEFYTDNKDFEGNKKLAQDPVLGLETHLSYDISKSWYASLDYFYNHGGETKINGVKTANSEIDSHGLGLSLFWMIGSNNQLMIEYRDDFAIKNGPGTNTFGARWAYFF